MAFLGIGQTGEYAKAPQLGGEMYDKSQAVARELEDERAAMRSPTLYNAINQYAQGNMSLADMLKQAGQGQFGAGQTQEFVTSAPAAGRYAQEQVGLGPLTSQLYGKGGMLPTTLGQLGEAQGGLYNYTPQEAKEFGQASHDITKRSGQQAQALTQALAMRGLSAAPSGAANQAFLGNESDRLSNLANMQTALRQQTLDQRMKNISQLQNFSASLAGQQNNAINSQLASQFSGRNASENAMFNRVNNLNQAANTEMNRQIQQAGLNQEEVASRIAATSPTLGQAFGKGLTAGMAPLANSGFMGIGKGFGGGSASGGSGGTMMPSQGSRVNMGDMQGTVGQTGGFDDSSSSSQGLGSLMALFA